MSDFDDIIEELKQKRDELRLQVYLASKEIKEEWDELEKKMEDFSGKGPAVFRGREAEGDRCGHR